MDVFEQAGPSARRHSGANQVKFTIDSRNVDEGEEEDESY